MNWVNRINRYFLDIVTKRRARSRPPSSPKLLLMSPALIDRLGQLDLASHDGFIGETWVLWGTLVDGTLTAISETDTGWDAMRNALEQSGRLRVDLPEAELQLLADPDRKPRRLIGDAKALPDYAPLNTTS